MIAASALIYQNEQHSELPPAKQMKVAADPHVGRDQASAAADACETCNELRQALESRSIIAQAMGLLMERHSISSDQAFLVLRRVSQDTNTRVRRIAEDVVAAHNADRDQKITI